MKSYKSLRTLSVVFQVVAWVQLAITLLFTIIMIFYNPEYPILVDSVLFAKIGIALWMLIVGLFSFLLLYSFSQLIMLFINSADNIQNIAENVYVIASKNESKNDSGLIH